ncbi:hypothetical protein FACS189411_02770 [Bacteroidia bacterium]|nr:hypothetical protein FACS189411_02770 [Bacteroidia bacterium]
MSNVIGDHIYDINLNAFNAITGMTLNRVVSLSPGWNDGNDPDFPTSTPTSTVHRTIHSVFVDMDRDGKLEMIVAHSYSSDSTTVLYIADPSDGTILAAKYIRGAREAGYPFVGDVDADGKPDISLIKD